MKTSTGPARARRRNVLIGVLIAAVLSVTTLIVCDRAGVISTDAVFDKVGFSFAKSSSKGFKSKRR